MPSSPYYRFDLAAAVERLMPNQSADRDELRLHRVEIEALPFADRLAGTLAVTAANNDYRLGRTGAPDSSVAQLRTASRSQRIQELSRPSVVAHGQPSTAAKHLPYLFAAYGPNTPVPEHVWQSVTTRREAVAWERDTLARFVSPASPLLGFLLATRIQEHARGTAKSQLNEMQRLETSLDSIEAKRWIALLVSTTRFSALSAAASGEAIDDATDQALAEHYGQNATVAAAAISALAHTDLERLRGASLIRERTALFAAFEEQKWADVDALCDRWFENGWVLPTESTMAVTSPLTAGNARVSRFSKDAIVSALSWSQSTTRSREFIDRDRKSVVVTSRTVMTGRRELAVATLLLEPSDGKRSLVEGTIGRLETLRADQYLRSERFLPIPPELRGEERRTFIDTHLGTYLARRAPAAGITTAAVLPTKLTSEDRKQAKRLSNQVFSFRPNGDAPVGIYRSAPAKEQSHLDEGQMVMILADVDEERRTVRWQSPRLITLHAMQVAFREKTLLTLGRVEDLFTPDPGTGEQQIRTTSGDVVVRAHQVLTTGNGVTGAYISLPQNYG